MNKDHFTMLIDVLERVHGAQKMFAEGTCPDDAKLDSNWKKHPLFEKYCCFTNPVAVQEILVRLAGAETLIKNIADQKTPEEYDEEAGLEELSPEDAEPPFDEGYETIVLLARRYTAEHMGDRREKDDGTGCVH